MADLYKAKAGSVVKLPVENPAFITIDGLDISGKATMLMTSMKIDRGQGFQTLRTLGNTYYIYAFGEMPGKILVGGMLFFRGDCNGAVSGQAVADINRYFDEQNIYDAQEPVGIAIGSTSFTCLLTSMSISGDMSPYNFASFSLAFVNLPKK